MRARIVWADEVDSTNAWAAREAEKGAAHGTLFVAKRQSAGRGRLGRAWDSEGKGLYMTLLLRPQVQAREVSRAPLLAAVALRDALASFGVDALIKWPNDIVVGGRKLCGILCEARAKGMLADWCALGTGVNLHQRAQDFSEGLTATSLWMELGERISSEAVIEGYLAAIARWYAPCFEGDSAFMDAYSRVSATIGRTVMVIEGESRWPGEAVGIGQDGALIVQTGDGTRAVYAADVSVRGVDGYV